MSTRSDFAAGEVERSGEIDLAALKRAVARRKKVIFGATLAVAALAGAYVTIATPRYTAESQILLENQESFFTRPERQSQGTELQTAADPEAVASQVQLVASRDLARRAVRQLGLVGNREFDPLADGMGILTRLLVLVGLQQDPTRIDPEDRVLELFQERLNVYSPTKTRLIVIDFQSKDADLAARAANKVAELYLDAQSLAKRDTARGAAGSLAALNTDLRGKLAKANADVEQFRTSAGLLAGTNNMTITGQQLAELNSELSKARTSQADAQAKVSLIRDMIRHNRVSEIPDVANNDFVRRIAEQRVTLRAQLALESRTLLPMHPRIKELNAQLADLDAQLRALADKTVRSLENDAKIAAIRVTNLDVALDAQKKAVGTANVDEVRLHELERIAQAYKDQLDSTTTKYQEAVARENSASTPADARIITRAVPPQVPSYPKKVPILVFATVATLVMAVGLVISMELLGGQAVPEMRPVERPARRVAEPPLRDRFRAFGQSAAADAVRVEPAPLPSMPPEVDTSAEETAAAVAPRILAMRQTGRATRVAATSPGDNDLIVAPLIALARRLAREGRTILVDLDGRSAAHQIRDLLTAADGPKAGLGDLLSGSASFAEVIHRDIASRLHVIPAATAMPMTADFDLVLDALSETYDFLLMLAPPMADGEIMRRLAPHADTVLLASRSEADDPAIVAAHGDLVEAGAQDILLVTPPSAPARGSQNVA